MISWLLGFDFFSSSCFALAICFVLEVRRISPPPQPEPPPPPIQVQVWKWWWWLNNIENCITLETRSRRRVWRLTRLDDCHHEFFPFLIRPRRRSAGFSRLTLRAWVENCRLPSRALVRIRVRPHRMCEELESRRELKFFFSLFFGKNERFLRFESHFANNKKNLRFPPRAKSIIIVGKHCCCVSTDIPSYPLSSAQLTVFDLLKTIPCNYEYFSPIVVQLNSRFIIREQIDTICLLAVIDRQLLSSLTWSAPLCVGLALSAGHIYDDYDNCERVEV